MSLASDILETRQLLEDNRGEHDTEESMDSFEEGLIDLEVWADRAEELEMLVEEAHDLLTGMWCPDDVERHKFLGLLERAIL